MHKILKDKGIIYLSTPNKISIINIMSDPHFGLPLVSILKRKTIKKYFLKYFRQQDYNRDDIAQLLSLDELQYIISSKFEFKLLTIEIIQKLFDGQNGIIWSSFHKTLVKLLENLGLNKFIIKISNNKNGFINKYVSPTFYLILQKKQQF